MGVVCGEVSEWVGRFLAKNIQFEVGVGDRVKFWTDRWCGDSPLQLTFWLCLGWLPIKQSLWPLVLNGWG